MTSLQHDFNWQTFGMYARDQPPDPGANLYGVHPFYVSIENDGNSHGVFFLNANAQGDSGQFALTSHWTDIACAETCFGVTFTAGTVHFCRNSATKQEERKWEFEGNNNAELTQTLNRTSLKLYAIASAASIRNISLLFRIRKSFSVFHANSFDV